jgi:hypothetical protein
VLKQLGNTKPKLPQLHECLVGMMKEGIRKGCSIESVLAELVRSPRRKYFVFAASV